MSQFSGHSDYMMTLLHRYFDEDLNTYEEKELFTVLCNDDSLRARFSELRKLEGLTRQDSQSLMPPAHIRSNVMQAFDAATASRTGGFAMAASGVGKAFTVPSRSIGMFLAGSIACLVLLFGLSGDNILPDSARQRAVSRAFSEASGVHDARSVLTIAYPDLDEKSSLNSGIRSARFYANSGYNEQSFGRRSHGELTDEAQAVSHSIASAELMPTSIPSDPMDLHEEFRSGTVTKLDNEYANLKINLAGLTQSGAAFGEAIQGGFLGTLFYQLDAQQFFGVELGVRQLRRVAQTRSRGATIFTTEQIIMPWYSLAYRYQMDVISSAIPFRPYLQASAGVIGAHPQGGLGLGAEWLANENVGLYLMAQQQVTNLPENFIADRFTVQCGVTMQF